MRSIAFVLLIALAPVTLAQSIPQWLIPSPWSVGITLAQWLSKENRKIFYVEVTAEGADLEQARQSAFRMAVERAVGTVVSAESESHNARLRRDEIITYASGYVDNYELVQSQTLNNRTQVRMKVWVSHNKLANRLLNESRSAGQVEGGRIAEQIRSLQHERQSGDQLLLSVLKDFPRRSFDVEMLPTRVTVDRDRTPWLAVRFNLKWNKDYVDSLATAIRSINQKNNCGGVFQGDCRAETVIGGGGAVAYMDDQVAWNLFLREMVMSRPKLEVRILDTSGQLRFRQCYGVRELDQSDYSPWRFVDVESGRVRVNHWRNTVVETNLPLVNDPRNLDRAEVRVVRAQDC